MQNNDTSPGSFTVTGQVLFLQSLGKLAKPTASMPASLWRLMYMGIAPLLRPGVRGKHMDRSQGAHHGGLATASAVVISEYTGRRLEGMHHRGQTEDFILRLCAAAQALIKPCRVDVAADHRGTVTATTSHMQA